MEYEKFKIIIENCHLNFLIGSGASKPFLGTLGAIETLLTDLSKEADDVKKEIVEASIKSHYFEVAINGNLKLDEDNTKLLETKKNYSDFVKSVNTILNRRKTNLISKQANLFTTNMDLFLEYILEEQNITYNDGFSGRLKPVFGTENFHNSIRKTSTHYEFQSEVPLFNVFKLHGSVNWKLEGDKIVYDNNLSILKNIEKNRIIKENCVEIEYETEINGEKTWEYYSVSELIEQSKDTESSDEYEMFLSSYNKLLMINPTKQKFETTTMDLTFYELLRMYSNHLERENSVLFVFGFSFADEHIQEITKRVALANPTLMIIIFAYNENEKINISKRIPERDNIIILSPKSNSYDLMRINSEFFLKLANELLSVEHIESNEKMEINADE